MDFQSLSRRELQALCKKNKIPANITNVAMADALKELEFVEGIEEVLKSSESETAKSSIESPQRSEITSPSVPRTGRRTVARKTVKDEPETLQTRSRRTTRRMMDETPAEAAPTTRRRAAAAASVGRKIEMPLKETEEVQKETSAVIKASRRREVKETSSIKHVFSTRRSTRLAEKIVDEKKERFEAIKMESFAMDENLEISSKEDSCEITGVTDYNGLDLNASSEDAEAVSMEKSIQSENGYIVVGSKEEELNNFEIDGVLNSDISVSASVEDEPSNDYSKADDAIEIKPEVHCEMSDKNDVHSVDNVEAMIVMENNDNMYKLETENALEKEMKKDTNKDEVSEFVADENVESKIPEVEGCTAMAVDFASCETVVLLESENGQILDLHENITTDAVIEGETEDVMKEAELSGELDGNEELESMPCETEGHIEPEIPDDNIEIDTVIEGETEDVMKEDGELTGGELDGNVEPEAVQIPDDNIEGETEDVTKEDKQPNTEDVSDVVIENASEPIIHPTYPTPVKSPLRTNTAMKKSAGRTPKTNRRMTGVSDDKENIDSGRKLVLTIEEKPKKRDFAGTNNQKPLEELSMRQLTKMFKEKLEITKLNKTKPDDFKVATARLALRPLSENCLVEETQK